MQNNEHFRVIKSNLKGRKEIKVDYLNSNKKEIYKIFADCGNDTTKIKCYSPNGEIQYVVIPTLVSFGDDKVCRDSYVIRNYNGSSYVIGDENKTSNSNIVLSKMDLSHKLPVLTAIHQCVSDNSLVELYVGLPIDSYYSEHRKDYVAFYEQEGTLTLDVNNVKKTFTLSKVIAMPEGVGHIFNSPVGHLIGVIDIGYTTIDGAVFKDCAPILETTFSLIDGANPFKTKVRDELNKGLMLNIQPYQMDEILACGLYGEKKDNAQKIIKRCQVEYLKKIVNEMLKHKWEIQSLPIVFTGGGSILLKETINEYETFIMSDNPIFDNLDGFGEMGMILSE